MEVALRVVLPLALNLLWVVAWLIVVPSLLGLLPLWAVPFSMFGDVDLVIVLSCVLALGWGVILRPMLVFLVLRKRDASEDAGLPVNA